MPPIFSIQSQSSEREGGGERKEERGREGRGEGGRKGRGEGENEKEGERREGGKEKGRKIKFQANNYIIIPWLVL